MDANIALIGIGSNFEDKEIRLAKAVTELRGLPDFEVAGISSVYLTEPQGFREQPWFANMVVAARPGSSWNPGTLLKALLEIEAREGRTRGEGPRYGPRAIDIDLLTFGDIKSSSPECVAPHPRFLSRAFALVPSLELYPDLVVNGVSARDALRGLAWRLDENRIYQEDEFGASF